MRAIGRLTQLADMPVAAGWSSRSQPVEQTFGKWSLFNESEGSQTQHPPMHTFAAQEDKVG